mmetsp:Transcript_49884/g.159541  ORF Transcript_49884/g.159541 Transcript_49884/m.159541 type:complete len:291 (-) Transcript_49884:1488-2360(-)
MAQYAVLAGLPRPLELRRLREVPFLPPCHLLIGGLHLLAHVDDLRFLDLREEVRLLGALDALPEGCLCRMRPPLRRRLLFRHALHPLPLFLQLVPQGLLPLRRDARVGAVPRGLVLGGAQREGGVVALIALRAEHVLYCRRLLPRHLHLHLLESVGRLGLRGPRPLRVETRRQLPPVLRCRLEVLLYLHGDGLILALDALVGRLQPLDRLAPRAQRSLQLLLTGRAGREFLIFLRVPPSEDLHLLLGLLRRRLLRAELLAHVAQLLPQHPDGAVRLPRAAGGRLASLGAV